MSAIEPTTTVEQYGTNVRVTQNWSSYLDKMARDIADRIDEETLARLGYVKRGTCHAIVSDNLTESEGTGDAWADCSECGHLLFVLTDPTSEPPNFCPNCGRKVVDDG